MIHKLKNISIASIGQVSTVLMQFVIVYIISTKGGLEEIGIYGLVSSFVIPITTFFLFDINSSVLAEKNVEKNFYNYFSSLLINSFLGFMIILAILYLLDLPKSLTLSFFLFRTTINLKEITYSYFQRLNKLDVISINQFVIAIVTSGLFFLFYDVIKFNIFYFAALTILITIISDFLLIKPKVNKILNIPFWKVKLNSGLMLGFNAILSSLKLNSPRYFVNFTTHNIELIGVITVYSQLITGLSVLNLIYSRLNLGKVGNYLKLSTDKAVKNIYNIIFGNYALIIVCGSLLMLIDKFVINLIFGGEYTNDIILFRLLLLIKAVTFPLVIIKIIFINKKIEKALTLISLVSAIVLFSGILFLQNILYFMMLFLVLEIAVMIIIFIILNKNLNELPTK